MTTVGKLVSVAVGVGVGVSTAIVASGETTGVTGLGEDISKEMVGVAEGSGVGVAVGETVIKATCVGDGVGGGAVVQAVDP